MKHHYRCPYCNKVLGEWPCLSSRDANSCRNSNPWIEYRDRKSERDASATADSPAGASHK